MTYVHQMSVYQTLFSSMEIIKLTHFEGADAKRNCFSLIIKYLLVILLLSYNVQ